jgi:hypothetical protein
MKKNIYITMFWLLLSLSSKAQVYISSSDSLICAGETVTLTALTPPNYNWCYWKAGSATSSKTIAIHPDSDTLVTVDCLDVSANSLVASFTQTVSLCTNIRALEFTEAVYLYPNPSTGTLKLIGVSALTPIRVYDMLGRLCFETKAGEGVTELNLSGKPQGVYFVNFVHKNQMILRKISLD